jgi:hypothetical protein
MSKNPNKWDGIVGAILKDKNEDVSGLFDVVFSYLERKTAFFEDFGNPQVTRPQRQPAEGQAGRVPGQTPRRQT